MLRKIFRWQDPASKKGKKYKLETVPDFIHLLESVIETDEQSEDFFKAYSEVCDTPEENIGYFAQLVKDKDVAVDIIDLFGVSFDYIPRHILKKEYRFSAVNKNG